MSRRELRSERVTAAHPEDGRRSEAGDSLVEVLIALTVLSVAALAMLLAFATSISGTDEHKSLVTFDTTLRTASAEVTSLIEQQPSSDFANCSGASQYSTPGSIPLPSGYSAYVSEVQYWTGAAFSTAQTPPTSGCPSSAAQNAPQLLTITVSHASQTSTITTVVDDPITQTQTSTCPSGTPTQLVWVGQPGNGTAGTALFPTPSVALEDSTGCVEQDDASAVTLTVTGGSATLNNCAPTLGYGQTTFSGCSINVPGTYTLTATDSTDNLSSVSSSFTVTAGAAAQLVFSTQPGNGTGGTAWSQQPKVTIDDSAGNPVVGDTSTVTLSIGTNPSGGTLSGCTDTTTSGVATFSGCDIDKAGTGYTLTATDAADNLTTPSTPSRAFNITVGPPAQLVFTTSPGNSVTGDAFGTQPVVTVEDAGGNTVTTDTTTVKLAIGTNPSSGTLSGCAETTSAGVASFTGCSINQAGNGYTLTAADPTDNLNTQSAPSSAFNVSAPTLTSFKVVSSTNAPTAGSSFTVTITALDQTGATYTNYGGSKAITFSGPSNSPLPTPSGTAPSYPSSVTFTSGVGTATITLYDVQSTTISATQGAVLGTSASLTVKPATVNKFSVTTPGPQTAGTGFGLSVTAVDPYGNTATTYTGSQSLTFSGPSNSPLGYAPSYPSSATFTNGVGAVIVTLYDAQSTAVTVTQSSLTGSTGTFTVGSGANPSIFSVANPGTQTAGSAFNLTVTAQDTYGNPSGSTYTGNQTLTFSGPSNSALPAPSGTAPSYPASVAFSNGVGTASVTLYDAQSTSITARQGSASGSSGSFTVNGLTTTSAFTLTNPGTSPTAGSVFSETITATDTYGNPTGSNYTGTKTLTFSGPSNSALPSPNGTAPTYPGSVIFSSSGVGTASMTLYDAQSTTITAAQGAISGTSASLTVKSTTASKFAVSNPGTQSAGTGFGVTITARDVYGNTATGYTGSQALTFSGPSNSPLGYTPSYPPTVTFTNGVGPAIMTLDDAQSTTVTVTQSSLTGSTGAFTVGSAPTTSIFSLSNPGTQTAGTAFNVTLTAEDTYGNPTGSNYTGVQTLTFSGPSNSPLPGPNGTAPTYPASVSFTNGTGTAAITLYDAQSASLTATQGSATGSSGSFTVKALTTTSAFTLTNPGTSPIGGSPFSETITAVDTYGNTTTGYAGSKTMSFSGPSPSPSPISKAPSYSGSVSFSSGTGTASITLYDAQSTTITATQGTLSGASASLTVQPAPASTFTVSNPGTETAGTAFNVTITALDAYDNNATGFTGSQSLTFSGPSNSPGNNAPTYPATVSFGSNGQGTASITLYDAQSTSLTVTEGSISGSSGIFTVNGLSTTSTFVVTNPGTKTAGTHFNLTVTAGDAYGNTTTGYSGTKTIAFSGPSNSPLPLPNGTTPSYPASVSFTSGVGMPLITLYDAQSTTITAAQGGITGTSTSFTVNPTGTRTGIVLTNETTQPVPSLSCSGSAGSLACSSTGESTNSGQVLTADFQAVDQYGNAVAVVSTVTVNLTATGNGSVSTSSVTISPSQTTSGAFTLTRSNGSGKTVTMTAKISGTTQATITLSS